MAIYHYSDSFLSRNKGRNVVQFAAYCHDVTMFDNRLGLSLLPMNKEGEVLHSEIQVPSYGPEWVQQLYLAQFSQGTSVHEVS